MVAEDHQSILSQMQIVNRFRSLPIVRSALDVAADGYSKIKSSNSIVNSAIAAAEQSIHYVTSLLLSSLAGGKFEKLEKYITIADNLACQGLEKLVSKVPVITKSPEQIYTDGLEKVGEIKNYGSQKVQDLKSLGYQKVESALSNPYAQAFSKIVDSAVELTDKTVDHYLPQADGEGEEQQGPSDQSGDQNVVKKMGSLSKKVRNRVYRQGVNALKTAVSPVSKMMPKHE